MLEQISCLLKLLHGPYTVSIAPYSLSRGNPLKFTSLRNIHSRICTAQRLHTQTKLTREVWHNIPLYINTIYIHVSHTSMPFEWNIYVCIELKSWRNILWCDVYFAGHLKSNSTNIWSDKRNVQNVQSGGTRGLELRTAALKGHMALASSLLQYMKVHLPHTQSKERWLIGQWRMICRFCAPLTNIYVLLLCRVHVIAISKVKLKVE